MDVETCLNSYYKNEKPYAIEQENDATVRVHLGNPSMLSGYRKEIPFTRKRDWEEAVSFPSIILRHPYEPDATDDYILFVKVNGFLYAIDLFISTQKDRFYFRYFHLRGGNRIIDSGQMLQHVQNELVDFFSQHPHYRLHFVTGNVEIV